VFRAQKKRQNPRHKASTTPTAGTLLLSVNALISPGVQYPCVADSRGGIQSLSLLNQSPFSPALCLATPSCCIAEDSKAAVEPLEPLKPSIDPVLSASALRQEILPIHRSYSQSRSRDSRCSLRRSISLSSMTGTQERCRRITILLHMHPHW
jgi:hypothetical protein